MTPSLWLTFLMAWPGPGGGIVGKWGKHSPPVFVFSVSLRRKISATHNDSNFWETSPVSLMCIWQSGVCITTSPGNLRDAGCTDASYISQADATHCSDISEFLPWIKWITMWGDRGARKELCCIWDLQLFKIDTFYRNVNKKLRNIMRSSVSLLFVTKNVFKLCERKCHWEAEENS